MTATENIFFAWGLFSGGATLLVAILILLFNATKHRRMTKPKLENARERILLFNNGPYFALRTT